MTKQKRVPSRRFANMTGLNLNFQFKLEAIDQIRIVSLLIHAQGVWNKAHGHWFST